MRRITIATLRSHTLDCQTLNEQFGISGHVSVTSGKGGRPVIQIDNEEARAEISLYGGQLLSYKPKARRHDALFVSDAAYYVDGKAIKGGIPVCWPWFGDDPEKRGRGAHGFVRNRYWLLTETRQPDAKHTRITLTINDDESSYALWPHRFALSITFTIGQTLRVELRTKNRDAKPFAITQALHTYFAIGDIGKTRVSGLDRRDYLDKVAGFARRSQRGDVTFDGEVDRIYLDTNKPLAIIDEAWSRQIFIDASHSRTTVVWNPWAAISASSADLGDDDFKRFVCVETANAANEVIDVAPDQSYTLAVEYRVTDQHVVAHNR